MFSWQICDANLTDNSNKGNEFEQKKLSEVWSYIILFKFIPILELSFKFASQIFHENINKPLDGAYLADFGIDISLALVELLSLIFVKAHSSVC